MSVNGRNDDGIETFAGFLMRGLYVLEMITDVGARLLQADHWLLKALIILDCIFVRFDVVEPNAVSLQTTTSYILLQSRPLPLVTINNPPLPTIMKQDCPQVSILHQKPQFIKDHQLVMINHCAAKLILLNISYVWISHFDQYKPPSTSISHYSPWFTFMIHHDSLWYTMFHHDSPLSINQPCLSMSSRINHSSPISPCIQPCQVALPWAPSLAQRLSGVVGEAPEGIEVEPLQVGAPAGDWLISWLIRWLMREK